MFDPILSAQNAAAAHAVEQVVDHLSLAVENAAGELFDAPDWLTQDEIPLAGGARVEIGGAVWGKHCDFDRPYALSQARNRAFRTRMEVRPGDVWAPHGPGAGDDGTGKTRCELSMVDRIPAETDWYASFSHRLSPDNEDEPGVWTLVAQVHDEPDPGERHSPAFAMQLLDGDLLILARHDPDLHTGDRNGAMTVVKRLENYRKGAWHNWVWRFRFSPDGHGVLEGWHNGRKVVDAPDIAMGYNNDGGGDYLKVGIYREAGAAETFAIDYANVEYSTDPALLERIEEPLPRR